jgi:hypothetical protein
MARGIACKGICLYPVTAYPGWDNSRHAEVGLFSTPLADGGRKLFQPLLDEVERQKLLFDISPALAGDARITALGAT